jgi:Peptidase family C25
MKRPALASWSVILFSVFLFFASTGFDDSIPVEDFDGQTARPYVDIEMSDSTVRVVFDAGNVPIELENDREGGFRLLMPGSLQRGSEGRPVLPVYNLKVALPPDADLSTVAFYVETAHPMMYAPSFPIHFGGPVGDFQSPPLGVPLRFDRSAERSQSDPQALEITSKSTFQIEGVETMRKWKYVDCLFSPLQYDTATGAVWFTDQITVELTFKRGEPVRNLAEDVFLDRIAVASFVNYDLVKDDYFANPNAKTSEKLAIVTRLAISGTSVFPNNNTGVWAYANWLNNQGLDTIVVNDIHFYSYSGTTAAEKARNWLIANYQSQNIGYVLLIGDPRSEGNDIVANFQLNSLKIKPHDQESNPKSYTDRWFADLDADHDWNYDGDDSFGEFCGDYFHSAWVPNTDTCVEQIRVYDRGVHLVPDVFVARLPIFTNSVAAQNALRSVLQASQWFMANEDNADWREEALVFGTLFDLADKREDGACGTWSCDKKTDGSVFFSELEQNVFSPRSYSVTSVFDSGEAGFAPDTNYQSLTGCPGLDYTHTYSEISGDEAFSSTTVIDEIVDNDAVIMMWQGHGTEGSAQRTLWDDKDSDHYLDEGACSTGGEEEVKRTMVTYSEVLSESSRNRRFFAFLSSCQNGSWDHDPNDFSLAEALLGRFAVAVVASTHDGRYGVGWEEYDEYAEDRFLIQDIAYRFAEEVTRTAFPSGDKETVGQAFWEAASPVYEAPGISSYGQYVTPLLLNLQGDPRLRVKGNL